MSSEMATAMRDAAAELRGSTSPDMQLAQDFDDLAEIDDLRQEAHELRQRAINAERMAMVLRRRLA